MLTCLPATGTWIAQELLEWAASSCAIEDLLCRKQHLSIHNVHAWQQWLASVWLQAVRVVPAVQLWVLPAWLAAEAALFSIPMRAAMC